MSSDSFLTQLLSVKLLSLNSLRPTENHDTHRVSALEKDIINIGVWKVPLLIEENKFAIMDGHHRFQVAKNIGLQRIPCLVIGYDNPFLRLSSGKVGVKISPECIINAGLTGNLLPYKSTVHILELNLLQIKVPIELLRIK